ncbi:Ulp1-like peptidase [Cucumis melo var. makuwa]|uniref:Ulp1-like peptidase n=1 Tax=Cucumis melo var. makuwa TaxID=1194695 RepID=A0A5D3CVD3_CUCMM|nr:Ulp1-like peptidase [Cucumis melo var. makuwa]
MAVPDDKYFPAIVSCQVHKIDNLIKEKLTEEQLKMFHKTMFGPLLNVNMVFNDQLIDHFLLRKISEEPNTSGLWPTNVTLDKALDNKHLHSLLFDSQPKKITTCLDVEEVFKNFLFIEDDDSVKVALALFIETVMLRKDKKMQFDVDILGRVDDEEVFKNFDWSTFFYTRLLNSLKMVLQGKKEAYKLKRARTTKAVTYYNIKGYVLAFQLLKAVIGTLADVVHDRDASNDDFNNLRSTSSPLLQSTENVGGVTSTVQPSQQREERQLVVVKPETNLKPTKKRYRSSDKGERSHSKSYKRLDKEIKEVRKDVCTLTSIVCRMDDQLRKQSLELSEMKHMLQILV